LVKKRAVGAHREAEKINPINPVKSRKKKLRSAHREAKNVAPKAKNADIFDAQPVRGRRIRKTMRGPADPKASEKIKVQQPGGVGKAE